MEEKVPVYENADLDTSGRGLGSVCGRFGFLSGLPTFTFVYFRGRPKLSRRWYKKLKVGVVACAD